MTTLSIIYILSFILTIPLWGIAHSGLLGETVSEDMLQEAERQGVLDELSDKDYNKTLVFILGIACVTPVVNTILAMCVIKSVLFK